MEENLRSKIIARAWKDEAFRNKLLSNPRAAMKEFGVDLPKEVEMKVMLQSPEQVYFILPSPPCNSYELSEAELANTIAGYTEMAVCELIGRAGSCGGRGGALSS